MTDIVQLDSKGLRRFGISTAAILSGLFGLLLPVLFSRPLPLWPWVVSVPLCLLALLAPILLGPVYTIWMRIGFVMGWVNTRLLLGIAFFAVVLPTGILLRATRGDPMNRQFDTSLSTYKKASRSLTRKNMEDPF